ncbi:hypothetical protein EC973_003153 [Apophysomyces ossiformis]|uniref:D-isomer specific 2-hydroxyacid dehydrogenase NAD-binding domain-containing protein n=1 Tax=Apophysomyces ossiformis TaxID=679940 RepID=A0A8H7BMR4_9FUNG|nr:hypothetical protein EC973_003153 [Apophysomyces ossiformis]
MVHKVLVTRELPPQAQARLESLDIELVQWHEDTVIPRAILLDQVKGIDAVICLLTEQIDAEFLEAAGSQLKVVATMSVGYDHVDVDALRARQVKLGHTPNVLTDATADLTVMLTLAAARRMKEAIKAAETGEFTGKTLGVIGLGRIGAAVAHRLKAFGISRILYSGRTEKVEAQEQLNAEFVPLDTLLNQSDYVVVCCALNAETKHMLNYDAFTKMKKTAVFVNTARGDIVKQDDLIRALEENVIAAAGLDVTTPEPLPTDNKLFQLPNCVVLPHIGKELEIF